MLTCGASAFVVAVRSLIRFVIVRKPGYDEYTIIVALFFTIGYMIEILILRANHVGFPASTLTTNNMLELLQTTLAVEVTYYLIVGFIKTSILCMYLRFGMPSCNLTKVALTNSCSQRYLRSFATCAMALSFSKWCSRLFASA